MTVDPAYGRRDFLKDSVRSVVKAAREFSKEVDAVPSTKLPAMRTDWLRPPGAVDETLFLELCTRCGDCIKDCPPGAIVAHEHDATPILFADQSPCLLCDDFPCIAACQTGALEPVEGVHAVRMGYAVVSHTLCTAGQGCHACVSHCPRQAITMDFRLMQVEVVEGSCVGCGICENVCKTVNDHVAIRVRPTSRRTESG